jgi:hypothetical protein
MINFIRKLLTSIIFSGKPFGYVSRSWGTGTSSAFFRERVLASVGLSIIVACIPVLFDYLDSCKW